MRDGDDGSEAANENAATPGRRRGSPRNVGPGRRRAAYRVRCQPGRRRAFTANTGVSGRRRRPGVTVCRK